MGRILTTHVERWPAARHHPTPALEREPHPSRRRIVVVEDDPEMLALLRDILADDYEIAVPAAPVTVAGIDAEEPDLMLIGMVGEGSGSTLSPDDIVALASQHMRLHQVPIVALTADPNLLEHHGGLLRSASATLVSLRSRWRRCRP